MTTKCCYRYIVAMWMISWNVVLQVASLTSATLVCALRREQQYFLNAKGQIARHDQLSALARH